MALIPLYEAKTYLRVDSSDEDALIGILLSSAEQMCKDVGRLSEDQWEAVNAADRDAENGVQPTRELEALLTIGLVNDMFTERQNDDYPYKELASQHDMDVF